MELSLVRGIVPWTVFGLTATAAIILIIGLALSKKRGPAADGLALGGLTSDGESSAQSPVDPDNQPANQPTNAAATASSAASTEETFISHGLRAHNVVTCIRWSPHWLPPRSPARADYWPHG